jgi:hypothetical protein
VEALDILVDEILDKVENDNPQFQEDVLQAATSAVTIPRVMEKWG